jgi:glucokinase
VITEPADVAELPGDRSSDVIGIDVGGTSIKGLRLAPDNAIVATHRRPTQTPDPSGDRTVQAVADVVGALGGRSDVAGVGVVVPGIVDETRGLARWSANIGWRDLAMAAMLAERIGGPLAFGHDVRAGAIAEMRTGAAAGAAGTVVFLPIGTGISAAVVVEGQPIVGCGWAGEIGQLPVTSGGATAPLEAVASAAAVARRAGATDARAVVDRLVSGEPTAERVWRDAIAVLGDALAAIVALLAPSTVVIGGGLADAGDVLLEPLAAALRDRVGHMPVPVLCRAEHGASAAAIGAAYLARDQIERDLLRGTHP